MQITVLTYSPGPMGNEANMWTATFGVDGVATFKAIEAGNGGILQFEPLSSDPTQSQEQRATIRRMEEWGLTLPKAEVEGDANLAPAIEQALSEMPDVRGIETSITVDGTTYTFTRDQGANLLKEIAPKKAREKKARELLCA
jgi:hypothetical protein